VHPMVALKRLALCLMIAACASATANDEPPVRSLLFIGNSLTYANDMPGMLSSIASAADDSVRVGMAAGPNLAVIDHTNGSTDAVAQIDSGSWSFVLLQQGPTPAGICRDTLIIATMRLAPHIRAAGGRPVLFLPWARRPPVTSLEDAGQSAELAARAVGGAVAPIGIAWKHALEADASTTLYSDDGYHPAPLGTFLAALTIYDRLFQRDVRTISAASLQHHLPIPLTISQIGALESVAHQASQELPQDPTTPVPADTTVVSAFGGPC
jgi:hypothetical protein